MLITVKLRALLLCSRTYSLIVDWEKILVFFFLKNLRHVKVYSH